MNGMLRRAKDAFAARHTQAALSLVNDAIEEGAESWSALMLRGRVLERLGRFAEAAADFRRVRALNPTNEGAATADARIAEQEGAFDRAGALLAAGRPGEALDLLQSLPSAGALTRQVLIARALLALRRLPGAEAGIDRVLAEDPDHAEAVEIRARIRAARGGERGAASGPADPPGSAPRSPSAMPPSPGSPRRVNRAADAVLAEDVAAIDHAVASGGDIALLVERVRGRRAEIAAAAWCDDPVLAKAAHFAFAADVPRAIRNYNAYLIERSAEFEYITWPRRIQEYILGKSVLDVGCGYGAYGNGFLVAGAREYTGVDPQMLLDSSSVRNKRIRKRANLGMTPRQVMAVCPDIHLVDGSFEDFAAGTAFDAIVLHNVTEHLLRIEQVMTGIRALMTPASRLIFHHHNFYCWNGHHRAPNQPAQYDEGDEAHRLYADWRHILIAGDLPSDHYFNTGLNQIRLDEFKALIDRLFTLEIWDEIDSSKDTERRLDDALLSRLQAHDPTLTRRDLIVNRVFGVAKIND